MPATKAAAVEAPPETTPETPGETPAAIPTPVTAPHIPRAVDPNTIEATIAAYGISRLTKDSLAQLAWEEVTRLARDMEVFGEYPPSETIASLVGESVTYLAALVHELKSRFEYDRRHPRV